MLANQKIPSANFLAPMSQLTFADRMAEVLLMDLTAINEYSEEYLDQLRVDFAKIKSRMEEWLKSNTSTEQAKGFWVLVYARSLVGHIQAERILQEAVSLAALEQASTTSSFRESGDSVSSASGYVHGGMSEAP
ncbi:hypothetical protein NliqN6_5464 [Naganishia liquefaciens]|uniref:Uncharacterized protein n=1 Tax=Naganishia liquefaciens TaxID=104408 RepID=A0A8H3TXQ6_9TREE|nr:hypothetical protein NliqN6_5464 [Naganishia liquefaciens]